MNYLEHLSELEALYNKSKSTKDLEDIKEQLNSLVLPDIPPEEQVTLLDIKYNLQRKVSKKTF